MKNRPDIPLQYYPLWFLLKGLALLPLKVLYVLSDLLYLLAYYVIGYRRKVVDQNLRNAFPDKGEEERKQIAKEFYRHFADIIVEILKLGAMTQQELRERIHFSNQEVLDDFVQQGKPVITMGSHAGNWEWILSAGAVQFAFPAEGVYKPLNNPFFEVYMHHLRSRLGARLIRMKDTMRDFIRNRHTPRVIAMLSDQTPPREEAQYWTTFMHQDAAFYVGAEKLAASFGYPVLYLDVARTSRGYYTLTFQVITADPNSASDANSAFPATETFARLLEASIRRQPASYLWTHRRWKHKKV